MKAHVIMTLFWVAIAACASATERTPTDGLPETFAVVVNHGHFDVRVYASTDGSRVPLGFVTSGSIQRYKLDSDLVRAAWLTLIADPVGSTSTLESEPVTVRAGDIVEWTIMPRSENSSVIVR